MLEKRRRRINRRDAGNVFRRRPGQDRRPPVDTLVRKPALGRADQPARHLGPVVARKAPDDPFGCRFPGQFERARRKLLGGRNVQERREQGPLRHVAQCDDLRNDNRSTGAAAVSRTAVESTYASAEFVVPRSIPIT